MSAILTSTTNDPPVSQSMTLTPRRLSILACAALLASGIGMSAALDTWADVRELVNPLLAVGATGASGSAAFVLAFVATVDVLRRWIG
ncbi:hypothetical protein [Actinosynnema sp. NPDC023587]|uniref:hypothetical protein n=1 Tax=Actinosynnema sp. NPDC023587 TaxID=3154695 RepID=UPI0033F9BDD3